MTEAQQPPMSPTTDEATPEQLEAARAQGDAYGRAVELMAKKVAHDGGQQHAGEYIVGYAVESAEGMYHYDGGQLRWVEPQDENCHIEVAVRDAGDGRFVPGVRVHATLIDAQGNEIGTHEQPLLWHPMLYHYGRNWKVPGDGEYRLRVRIEPPTFMRHDKVNGCRFAETVEAEFPQVRIKTGRK